MGLAPQLRRPRFGARPSRPERPPGPELSKPSRTPRPRPRPAPRALGRGAAYPGPQGSSQAREHDQASRLTSSLRGTAGGTRASSRPHTWPRAAVKTAAEAAQPSRAAKPRGLDCRDRRASEPHCTKPGPASAPRSGVAAASAKSRPPAQAPGFGWLMRPSLSALSHTPPRAILRGVWGLAGSEAGSGRWLGGREGVGLRQTGVPPGARALRRGRPGRRSRALLPSFLTGPAALRCILVAVVSTPPGPGPGSRGLVSRFLLWRGK